MLNGIETIVNTTEELSILMSKINEEVLPELSDDGTDIRTEPFSIIQPFTSEQFIQASFHDIGGERTFSVDIGGSIEDVSTEGFNIIVALSEREGYLDVFEPDTKDKELERIERIVKKSNNQ